jgi:hypothetical protein
VYLPPLVFGVIAHSVKTKWISSHYSCRTSFETRSVYLPLLVFGVVAHSVKTIVITLN